MQDFLDRQEMLILRNVREIYVRMFRWKDRQEKQRMREEMGEQIPVEEYIKPLRFGAYFRSEEDRLANLNLLLENIALRRRLNDAEADVGEQV